MCVVCTNSVAFTGEAFIVTVVIVVALVMLADEAIVRRILVAAREVNDSLTALLETLEALRPNYEIINA